MKTRNETLIEGYKALTDKLGLIDAEKFIAYIQRKPFDYTIWQRDLFKNQSTKNINKKASEFKI
jgi:hypothetical protein